MQIRALRGTDDRSRFRSGDPDLDQRAGLAARKTLRRTTMSTSKRTALLGFFMASLAAPAMAAEGEGAAVAVAPEKPSGEPTKMFIGGGIGPALNPRYKVNGKTITFSDQFQGATDKISPIALSVSFGLALNPNTFVGFDGSAASQIGKIAGTNTHVQISNYFAGET